MQKTIREEICQIKELLSELKVEIKYNRTISEKTQEMLNGENGLCIKVDRVKTKLDSHLQSHWKILTAIIGIFGVVFGFIELFARK